MARLVKKNNFLNLLSLLFLVMAVSVGVALASGKSALLYKSGAASCAGAGPTSSSQCCPGLEYKCQKGKTCGCYGNDKCSDFSRTCSNNIIYSCYYGNAKYLVVENCKAEGWAACEGAVGMFSKPTCIDNYGNPVSGKKTPKPTTAPTTRPATPRPCGKPGQPVCAI